LNRLIESCRDSERGFRLAAEHVAHADVRKLFREVSAQRATFAAELLPYAQRRGGDAPAEGTTGAALHRGWIGLKGALLGNDQAIIAEAKRGDQFTVRAFADAVNGMLPPDARELVERQFVDLQHTHERVEALG
jgi:uncharacterized protein (TIGR02284 family)